MQISRPTRMTNTNHLPHSIPFSTRRPKSLRAVVLAACVAVALTGCHQKPGADVVAMVNGHPIMRADLDKAYDDQLAGNAQQKPSDEQADSLRLQLLGELINYQIVEQRAAKMNLTATPDEVDAKLAEMKAPYTEDQFNQRLAEHHTNVEGVKRDLSRSITYNKLINKEVITRITVSDADINNYFNAHKAEFNNIETTYHLAQILVTNTPPPPNASPANLQGNKATNDEEARKKIQALKNRIDAGGDFGTLAMNFSENPQYSSNNGDMGLIKQTELQQSVGPVLFGVIDKLKAGQTTDIIPLPDPTDPKKTSGYMILQLIAKEPAGQHDLSEPQVQQHIREGLRDARSQLLKAAYFEMLRDQSKIENYFAEDIFKTDAH